MGSLDRKQKFGYSAVRIQSIENRPVITHVADIPSIQQTLEVGSVIASVNGVNVDELLKQERFPRISASTQQDLENRAFSTLLRAKTGSQVEVGIRTPAGKQSKITLTCDGKKHLASTPWRDPKPLGFKKLDNGIVYLALNTFADPAVVKAFDRNFDEIKSANGLILDVRNNGGGSSGIGYAIIGRFIREASSKSSKWRTRIYRPAFRSWGSRIPGSKVSLVESTRGALNPYTGPIVVLTGAGTYSAAEDSWFLSKV